MMDLECLHGVLPLLAGGAKSSPCPSRQYAVSFFLGNVPLPAPPSLEFSASGLDELAPVLLAAPLLEGLHPPGALPELEQEAAFDASSSNAMNDLEVPMNQTARGDSKSIPLPKHAPVHRKRRPR